MATQTKDTATTTDHDSDLTAAVNAPQLVMIFDRVGHAMQVPPDTAEVLIQYHGFRRSKINLDTAAQEFQVLFTSAVTAIETFITGVITDGVIDPADQAAQATAYAAMELITTAWGDLCLEIARQYPIKQGEGVILQEQRAVMTIGGAEQEMSMLDLAARRHLDPDNPAYAEGAVQYRMREVEVDPAQVEQYLNTPGFSR